MIEVTRVRHPVQCWTHSLYVFHGGSGPAPGCSTHCGIIGIKSTTRGTTSLPFYAAVCVQGALYFCTPHAPPLHGKLCVNWDCKSSAFAAPHRTPHTEPTEHLQKHMLVSAQINFPFCLSFIFLPGFIFFSSFSSTSPGRIFKVGLIVYFVTKQ